VSVLVVLVGLSIATFALKSAGPMVLGGRPLPPVLTRLADLLPAALLAALVAVTAFGRDQGLVLDARVVGLAAAAVALVLRAHFVVVIVVAAAATALTRLIVG
jgi:branched-subunit amino acid transport protein